MIDDYERNIIMMINFAIIAIICLILAYFAIKAFLRCYRHRRYRKISPRNILDLEAGLGYTTSLMDYQENMPKRQVKIAWV